MFHIWNWTFGMGKKPKGAWEFGMEVWGTRLRWWCLCFSNLYNAFTFSGLSVQYMTSPTDRSVVCLLIHHCTLVCVHQTHDYVDMEILFFTFQIDSEHFLFTMSGIMSFCTFPISPSYTFLTLQQSLWCPSTWYLALWLHFSGIQTPFMKKTFQKLYIMTRISS